MATLTNRPFGKGPDDDEKKEALFVLAVVIIIFTLYLLSC